MAYNHKYERKKYGLTGQKCPRKWLYTKFKGFLTKLDSKKFKLTDREFFSTKNCSFSQIWAITLKWYISQYLCQENFYL